MKRLSLTAMLPITIMFSVVSPAVFAKPPVVATVSPAERLAQALKNPVLAAPDLRSVRKLSAYVAARDVVDDAYKAVVADAKKRKLPVPPRPLPQAMETDWYEAFLQELRERAYPNDTVDPDILLRGEDLRDRMPAAQSVTRDVSAITRTDVQSSPGKVASSISKGNISRVITPDFPSVISGSWEFVGPKNLAVKQLQYYGPANSNISGRINGLAIHPTNGNTAYAAVGPGGVWKTVDGGTNWNPVADLALSRQETSCVAIHPTNPSIVLVGLGDSEGALSQGTGRGILRSTDGGSSWTTVSLPLSPYRATDGSVRDAVSAIVFDPDTPSRVIATSSTYAGYRWRSDDAGATWTIIADPKGGSGYTWWSSLSVGQKDGSGTRLYYAGAKLSSDGSTSSGTTGSVGLWRSADKGSTWTQITLPAAFNGGTIDYTQGFEVAASAVDPYIVYIVRASDKAIFKGVCVNGGLTYTWTEIGGTSGAAGGFADSQNWGQSSYNLFVNCAAQTVNGVVKDALYVSVLSFNGALGTNDTNYVPNWVDIGKAYISGSRTHSDNHCIAISPSDSTKMIIGNDGGFYPVTYNTLTAGTPTDTTWTFTYGKNANIFVTQFYQADFHPYAPNFMLGGLQDNAQPVSTGDLDNWINAGGGDGSGAAIDKVNPLRQYTLYNSLGVITTSDGWKSSEDLTPAFLSGDARPLIGYVGIDPNYPNALYLGSNYLYRYSPLKGAWEARLGSQNLTGDTSNGVRVIAVAPSNSKTIYAGTPNGKLWVSFNSGANWTALSNSGTTLPNRAITGVDVNPTNDKDILVTLSGTGGGHVYQCSDTSAATPTFTDRSTGLPDVPFNCIARDYGAATTTWYAGTDIGVFQTTNGGTSWTNATLPLGLPNISVRTLKALPGTGYLMAATHGRGIWRIALQSPLPSDSSGVKARYPLQTPITPSLNYSDSSSLFEVPFTFANIGGADATEVTVNTFTVTVNGTNWPLQPTSFTTPFVFSNVNNVPKSYGTVIKGAGAVSVAFPIRSTAVTSGTSYPGIINATGTYKENGVLKNFQFSGRIIFKP